LWGLYFYLAANRICSPRDTLYARTLNRMALIITPFGMPTSIKTFFRKVI
jgi:hypothetical protein